MQHGQAGAPSIGHGEAAFPRNCEEFRERQTDGLLKGFGSAFKQKFDVYGIAVANGDGGLQPIEADVPHLPEGIGASVEIAEILHPKVF